jgi:hypothetical protein
MLVMQVWGDAFGRPTGWDGQFIVAFDFEAFGGQGEGRFTPDIAKARRFETMEAVHGFYNTVPLCQPLRIDGRPNKPLTSTNWQVFDPDL